MMSLRIRSENCGHEQKRKAALEKQMQTLGLRRDTAQKVSVRQASKAEAVRNGPGSRVLGQVSDFGLRP